MTPPRSSQALRLALTPRWLVGLLVLLLLVVAAILLGRWQWDRTQTILDAERAAASTPVAVEQVYPANEEPPAEVPGEEIGRPVIVTGTVDPALQSIVTNRALDGQPGVWVVSGIRLADGRVVAVLRGWLPSATDPAGRLPAGPVSVTGVLQPDEPFYAGAVTAPGTVAAIARDRLAEQWGTPVLPGYVTLTSMDPPLSAAPSPVTPTVQTADVPFPLQNFFYAFQWWIFGAFAVIVYLRWLWIEASRVH